MNDVSDEILYNLLYRERIEQTMSKERVSTRFGQITNKILSNVKTFKSHARTFDFSKGPITRHKHKKVLELMKRMPKLDDGRIIVDWDGETLTQLAAINQSMSRKYVNNVPYPLLPYLPGCIKYIEGIKKFDPDYDGQDVDFVFDHRRVAAFMEKYPEMKLKLAFYSDELIQGSPATDNCYSLRIWPSGDGGYISSVLPSVKYVTMYLDRPHVDSLLFLPNIDSITIKGSPVSDAPNMPRTTVRSILSMVQSELQHLEFDMVKVDREDFPALRQIIDTHRLITFECTALDCNEMEVIEMIVSSPMNQLKYIRTKSVDLSYNHRNILFQETNCTDILGLMNRILIKFRWITDITFKYVLDKENICTIQSMFRDTENADHRRKRLFAVSDTMAVSSSIIMNRVDTSSPWYVDGHDDIPPIP